MNMRLPTWLLRATKSLSVLPAGLVVALLMSCGGSDDEAASYRTVAMAGELVDYAIDTTRLTYSYTIVESEFGLAGATGSGTLTRNADGSYTPSGLPDSRVSILPDGIVLGAMRERFGATDVTVPIVGLKDPVTTIGALAADYNYVHRGCASALCSASHGTFSIGAGGTWTSCRSGNLGAGPCGGLTESGTLEPRGDGLFRMRSGDGTDIGSAIGFNSAGQNILVIDLKDRRTGGFGVGMLVGGQQAAMTPALSDGSWVATTSSGHWFSFTASGSDINITSIDWVPMTVGLSITANAPWTGMVTTAWGEVGFIAGSGVYVLATPGGDVELGVKLGR